MSPPAPAPAPDTDTTAQPGGFSLSAQRPPSDAAAPVARRHAWGGWCLAAAVVWALLVLVPVLTHRGWPANHDSTAPVARMAAILGQWKIGHWIPVWSTHEQFGYGSPLPALYHKTFSYLSAAVLGATGGNAKAALVVPVLLLMVVAFCGMALCVRHTLGGRQPWLWIVGGATLVASNYATTDWLVRGAFAEFAAFALIPWLFGWCLLLLDDGRWRLWIGPLLALLALSHSSLALFALPVLGLALALALALLRWRAAHARRWIVPAAKGGALAFVLMLPFLLPMLAMGRFNRIDQLLSHPIFMPRVNRIEWSRYFWDPGWTWGVDWIHFTVQLDTACLLLLPLYLVLLLRIVRRSWFRQDVGSDAAVRDACAAGWTGAWLLATLALMGWLQSASALWVYERVPGAGYLQFPWRLLAYVTPVLVLCACTALGWLASGVERPQRGAVRGHRAATAAAGVLAAAMLVWTAYPKLWWQPLQYLWIPWQTIESELRQQGDYSAFGEFLPLVDWPPAGEGGLLAAVRQAKAFLAQPPPAHDRDGGCSATSLDAQPPRPERRSAEWRVVCARAGFATLPAFLAPGMKVQARSASSNDWSHAAATRSCVDPRLKVALEAGQSEVRVVFPNWGRTVRAAFMRPVFDFRRDCVGDDRGRDAAVPR